MVNSYAARLVMLMCKNSLQQVAPQNPGKESRRACHYVSCRDIGTNRPSYARSSNNRMFGEGKPAKLHSPAVLSWLIIILFIATVFVA